MADKILEEQGDDLLTEAGDFLLLESDSGTVAPPSSFPVRTWVDYQDDLDAEAMNDLELRIATFVSPGGGGGNGGTITPQTIALNLVDDFGADNTGGSDTLGDSTFGWTAAMNYINSQPAIPTLLYGVAIALYVPPGVYLLSDTIPAITAAGVRIYGAGPATRLQAIAGNPLGTFFEVGAADGTNAAEYVEIDHFLLVCNSTNTAGTFPPATDKAIHLNDGGHLRVHDLMVHDVAGLIQVGTHQFNSGGATPLARNPARVQRYQVHNVIGTFNEHTVQPKLIHIMNGTSGLFSGMEIIAHDLQGGVGVFMDPTELGCDQHWFTDIHFQGGSGNWVEIDVTEGVCYNWVFKHCVMDGSEGNNVYVHCATEDSNHQVPNSTVTDLHFIDCHATTRSGNGFNFFHNGSQDWKSIEVIGGRWKTMNGSPIVIHGTSTDSIRSISFQGCSFLHDHDGIGASRTSDNRVSIGIDTVEPGHFLSIGDELIFTAGTGSPGVLPANITAGNSYYVNGFGSGTITDWDADHAFTLGTTVGGHGGTVNVGNWTGTANFQVHLTSAAILGNCQGLRLQGCYFGGFYGVQTEWDYAMTGTPDFYNINGNVARGLNTNLAGGGGIVDSPPDSVFTNNVWSH